MTPLRLLLAFALAMPLALACDRNLAPYDPDEEPREPDLSKIFPKGAERAADVQPGLPEPPGRGAPPLAQEAGGDAAPITGTIRFANDFVAPLPDGAVLFLIARRGDAGPPLAVKRITDVRLPLEFRLGPEDRMIQAMPFAGPLRITARIDRDGNATSREPGDLQGAAEGEFDPGATGVEVLIDEVLGAAGGGAPPIAQQAGADAAAPITGTIRFANDFVAPLPDGAVLFLIARRGDAGPPLAVKRIPDVRVPMEFRLGPEDRMIQAMPFAGPLRITARIDRDGNATSREPGDLQGAAAGEFDPGATDVQVLIDEVL